MPLLSKKKNNFDIFIKSKLGFIKLNSSIDPIITPARGTFLDLTFNGGCSLYVSEHFGLTVEAGYKYFEYHKGFNVRGGFLFRF